MNNENKRFLDNFACLEFLPLLKSNKERARYFTGVCSSNFLPRNDMVKAAAELGLFNDSDESCIGDKKNINNFYHNGHDCAKVIQDFGVDKKIVPKICANCPHNPRYINKRLHNQEIVLAGMYRFGSDVIPSSVLSHMTYTVFFLGSTPNELKSVQIQLRGALYKILCNPDGFSSQDALIRSLVSNVLITVKKRGGYSASDINKLENEIKDYFLSILNTDVTENDVKEAYADLAEHLQPDNKMPIKISEVNMDDVSNLQFLADYLSQSEIGQPDECTQGHEVAGFPDNDSEEYSDSEYISDADHDERNTAPTEVTGVSNICDANEPISYGKESCEVSDSINDRGLHPEKDIDTGYEYKQGVFLDRESYDGTFCTAITFDGVRYALDLAYLFDNLAVDVVSCGKIRGLMIYSESFDSSAVFKGRPVFISKKFYSEHLFRKLFESHSFRVVSMTLELLCETAREYNVTRFIDCFSIRSAYKALVEENDELYPIKDVFKECGLDVPVTDNYYTTYAIKNYSRLRSELVYMLDTKHLSRRSHIWANYEVVLSSANHAMKSIGLKIDNLHRNSFLSNTFAYSAMPIRNKSYMVLKCVFKIGADKNELRPMFMPHVLNQIFNTVPFTRLHTELLEYGDDHLTVLVKTHRKENIVVAFEVIHTIIVRLCMKSGLDAPRLTDYQY